MATASLSVGTAGIRQMDFLVFVGMRIMDVELNILAWG